MACAWRWTAARAGRRADTPFAPDIVSLSGAVYNPNGNLALTATASADNTLAGFPASNANDDSQATYWQAANSTGALTLQLAESAPVGATTR